MRGWAGRRLVLGVIGAACAARFVRPNALWGHASSRHAIGARSASAQTLPQVVVPSGQGTRVQALPNVVTPDDQGGGGASARRGRGGTYWFDAEVNGATLPMLFDSGATLVTLRAEDADSAGVDIGGLRYTLRSMTANGPTQLAPLMLSSLTVGSITRTHVQAAVARPGALESNLLGQSFLRRIGGFRQQSDVLVLLDGP